MNCQEITSSTAPKANEESPVMLPSAIPTSGPSTLASPKFGSNSVTHRTAIAALDMSSGTTNTAASSARPRPGPAR
jgi:hypothetical protein